METQGIIEATIKAVEQVLQNEWPIIHNDVNERTICHKLAEYLQQKEIFSSFSVDIEYNRNYEKGRRKPKYLSLINRDYDKKINTIEVDKLEEFVSQVTTYPDIIIHERLINTKNLLVIEVKKDNNKSDWSIDEMKLRGFTLPLDEGYGYVLGAHITFFINERKAEIKWIENGDDIIDSNKIYY